MIKMPDFNSSHKKASTNLMRLFIANFYLDPLTFSRS